MLKRTIRGQTLWFLPERAIFWEETQTLLVADLHLGKVATFQAAGVPLPDGTDLADLQRLSAVLDQSRAKRLLILGDLIHARSGLTRPLIEQVSEWRQLHSDVQLGLIRGNHDFAAGDPPPAWDIVCYSPPMMEPPFAFCHVPKKQPDVCSVAGHIHPAVEVGLQRKQRVKLVCFVATEDQLVLPAFCSFTAGVAVRPKPGERIYGIVEGKVMDVSKLV